MDSKIEDNTSNTIIVTIKCIFTYSDNIYWLYMGIVMNKGINICIYNETLCLDENLYIIFTVIIKRNLLYYNTFN